MRIKELLFSKEREGTIADYICSFLLLNSLNSMVQEAFGIQGTTLLVIKAAINCVIFIMLGRCLLHLNKQELGTLVLIEILVAIIYLFSYLIGGADILSWFIVTSGICVPMAYLLSTVKNVELFYNKIVLYSWPILIVLVIDGIKTIGYNMHFSYGIVFILLVHINEVFKRKWLFLICAVFELILLLRFGSRGAIVCIMVFLISKIVLTGNGVQKYLCAILVALIAGLFLYVLDNYGLRIYELLSSAGYGSRSLYLLLSGQLFSHDSGRIDLWKASIEAIKQKPVLGWGIRGALSELLGSPYPHQLFLDLMLSLGIPIGGSFSVVILHKLYQCFRIKDKVHLDLALILLSVGFVNLMVSNTCFTSYYFFLFLGISFIKNTSQEEQIQMPMK